jgi:hypothetical protein
MKTPFKTLLLVATIAASCNTAFAGTVAVTKQTHSIEGLTDVITVQASNSITYTLGSAYAVSDSITFTFEADVITNTTF